MKVYRTIAPQDLFLGDKIGEGQFGDVHNGFLYPKVRTGGGVRWHAWRCCMSYILVERTLPSKTWVCNI